MEATLTVAAQSQASEVVVSVAHALAREGFRPARHESEYIEARRGRIRPMGSALLQARLPVSDVPVVVCVALEPTDSGATVRAAAYQDLGRWVMLGPVSRRTYRRATQTAVDLVAAAALGPCAASK